MSTLTAVPPAAARSPRAGGPWRLAAGRLLRLELRHSAMVWMLPLVLGLFWFDTYRESVALPAMWAQRVSYLELGHGIIDFAPFVAGAAAWTAARDSRRTMTEQVGVTAMPRWAARLSAWAAIACWSLLAYAVCVAALYGVTVAQHAGGTVPWWPVAVNAVGVLAAGALGFVAGVLVPTRFTAPLVGLAAELLLVVTQNRFTHSATYGLISPTDNAELPGPNAGVFSPFPHDVSLVQVVFLAGLVVTVIGVLGLPAAGGGRLVRSVAAGVGLLGLAVTGTGIALAGTARQGAYGLVVPAVHSAAEDRPLDLAPVCQGGQIPVCLSPAYRAYLGDVADDLTPLLREVAGLPGAPTRVTQAVPGATPSGPGTVVQGDPPVLRLGLGWIGWRGAGQLAALERAEAAPVIVRNVVGDGTPAQQAVEAGLMRAAGVPMSGPVANPGLPPDPGTAAGPAPGSPTDAAARRFAAQPAALRRAWLSTHLTALRTGIVTLEQLP